ncbi:response regulator [Pontibacter ruber]|uniref:Response regulator n=1 Tax=Pontibacter ruber TaxID=1343895 RepID=A0ABW5D1M2_9BACT|nr:response regulator [Pontibacter ruber]
MQKLNTILLVDDDEATNFLNELIIKKLDIAENILVARNGREAITLIRQLCEAQQGNPGLPELVLLDINMPVLDGFGFLKAFEELSCPGKEGVQIVLLSTSLNTKDVERAKEYVIKGFLNKPLSSQQLSSLLEES